MNNELVNLLPGLLQGITRVKHFLSSRRCQGSDAKTSTFNYSRNS